MSTHQAESGDRNIRYAWARIVQAVSIQPQPDREVGGGWSQQPSGWYPSSLPVQPSRYSSQASRMRWVCPAVNSV
jgi:hypothetical protein